MKSFNANPPATPELLSNFAETSTFQLPDEYISFLQEGNGGEGFVGRNAYVILWPVEDLVPMNEAYEAAKYAGGLLLFGSDGGGEAFAFDTRPGEKADCFGTVHRNALKVRHHLGP